VLIHKIDRLCINGHYACFQLVSIYFATHQPLAPGQKVRIDYGFNKCGERRMLIGVPRWHRTLRKKVGTVLYCYVLEQKVPTSEG
jgi:hypothetical protein